jgi:hypothetical protein
VAEPAARNLGTIPRICSQIAGSSRFQGLIFGVIVFNALVLGLETYDGIDAAAGGLLAALNNACLAVFLVELADRGRSPGGAARAR